MVTVFLSGASLVGLVIRMWSAYWKRVASFGCRSFRSLAKVSPKMVGEFLNPWGRTAQQYCCVCCVFEPCHPKAKISCGVGVNGIRKKASFKSNTEYRVLLDRRVASRVQGLGTTGSISLVASLTALRSCTIWHSPLDFFMGRMGDYRLSGRVQ